MKKGVSASANFYLYSMFLNNIDGAQENESEIYTKCIYTVTLHLQSGQVIDIKVDMVVTCQAELTEGAHMASSIMAASSIIISSSFFPTPGTFGISGSLTPNGPSLSFSICSSLSYSSCSSDLRELE